MSRVLRAFTFFFSRPRVTRGRHRGLSDSTPISLLFFYLQLTGGAGLISEELNRRFVTAENN